MTNFGDTLGQGMGLKTQSVGRDLGSKTQLNRPARTVTAVAIYKPEPNIWHDVTLFDISPLNLRGKIVHPHTISPLNLRGNSVMVHYVMYDNSTSFIVTSRLLHNSNSLLWLLCVSYPAVAVANAAMHNYGNKMASW